MKKIDILILLLVTATYLFFALKGISTNHSFWADEAYISSLARDINQEQNLFDVLNTSGAKYQPLYVVLIAVSFNLLGENEFAARLPTVLIGSLGIILTFKITSKLSGQSAAIIATLMYTFSQLLLAHATQAKPYSIIAVCTLAIVYLLISLSDNEHWPIRKILFAHFTIISLILIATLLQISAVILIVLYCSYILVEYKNVILSSKYVVKTISVGVISAVVLLLIIINSNLLGLIKIFSVNNLPTARELFMHQYLFLVVPSIFGGFVVLNKYKSLIFSLILWVFILFFFWLFVHYSRNIRYLLPFFVLLPIFFAIFWSEALKKIFSRNTNVFYCIFIILLFLGWNKLVIKPTTYYSPNSDLYADVQNANYKNAFAFIQEKYSNYQNIAIFNNIIDAQRWYLIEKPNATAYFSKHVSDPTPHNVNGVMVYGTLEDFLEQKSKYEQGLLIVEDWESILPDDIKQYAKKNMELEYRVESLDVSPTDKWPIEIYSWGMEE